MRQRLRPPHAAGPRGDGSASAVEYGLLLAAVAALVLVVVLALGRIVEVAEPACGGATDRAGASHGC